jgi:hypothetical protein
VTRLAFVTAREVHVHPCPVDQLHGAFLDVPGVGTYRDRYVLPLVGWALGRASRAASVEVVHGGEVVLRSPICHPRPDIGDAFPDVAGAHTSGFRAELNALRLRQSFELLVRIVLEDEVTLGLATIRGERSALPRGSSSQPQPIVLSTLGRTGSTWLASLLGAHPEIAVYRPWEHDARVASYWLDVLQSLAEPDHYRRQLRSVDAPREIGELGDPVLEQWLGGGNLEELTNLVQQRIERFYTAATATEGKLAPRYFVEKHQPRQLAADLLEELYPGVRQIVLVRDLRDVFCSILAFNAKRGYMTFGREACESDESYVQELRAAGQDLLDRWRHDARWACLVRYEDLIAQPGRTLAVVLEYLGFNRTDAGELLARTSQNGSDTDHHRTSRSQQESIGRWRRDLTPPLSRLCNHAFAPILAAFGYPVEESRPARDQSARAGGETDQRQGEGTGR